MPLGLVVVGICLFGLAGISAVWHFYVAYIVGRAIGGTARNQHGHPLGERTGDAPRPVKFF